MRKYTKTRLKRLRFQPQDDEKNSHGRQKLHSMTKLKHMTCKLTKLWHIRQDSARFCQILQDFVRLCKILQDSAYIYPFSNSLKSTLKSLKPFLRIASIVKVVKQSDFSWDREREDDKEQFWFLELLLTNSGI